TARGPARRVAFSLHWFAPMENKTPAWDDLRMLLAVSRHGSFLRAGVALGVATSTVVRRISALERAVGRPLVRRDAGGSSLEPEAARLTELAHQLDLGLATFRRDRSSSFTGTVRITAGDGFVPAVVRAAARFRRDHPETLIE